MMLPDQPDTSPLFGQHPTAMPTTHVPTAMPTTHVPTAKPTTHVPTAKPSTHAPTAPTVKPTTHAPTSASQLSTSSTSNRTLSPAGRSSLGLFCAFILIVIALGGIYWYLLVQWRRKIAKQPKVLDTEGGSMQKDAESQNPIHDDNNANESENTKDDKPKDVEVAINATNTVTVESITVNAVPLSDNVEEKVASEVTSAKTEVTGWKARLLMLPPVQKFMNHPLVIEFREFYADPENQILIEAIIRVLTVASHIVNSCTAMAFYIKVPTCCHSSPNQALATAIPTVALLFAIINFWHVLSSFPVLSASHFYLTAIYDLVLMINLIFMVLIMQYGSMTTYLLSLGSGLYALSMTWTATMKRIYNMKPFTIWSGWVLLNVVLWGPFLFLQIIFVIVGLAFSSYNQAYFFGWSPSGFIGDTGVISNAWHTNRPTEGDNIYNLYHNCTANFAHSGSYTSSQGGQVQQYCTYIGNDPNHQARGCCTWDLYN